MILNEYTSIKLHTNNVKYYENLGYIIPKKEASESSKKDYVYDFGKPILVKVSDLQPGSKGIVCLLCDYCMETIFQQTYNTYQRTIKDIPKCACSKCRALKVKELNELKYGYSWAASTKEFQDKKNETLLRKYGTTNLWDVPEIKEKREQTCIDRYGQSHYSKTEEFKERFTETCMRNRGTMYPTQSAEVREKVKESVREHYGTDNVFQSEEIKDKIRSNNLELYGVENSNQRDDVKIKRQQTVFQNNTGAVSMQQKYLCELYGGTLNYPIRYYLGDIVFIDEKLDIEYSGGGHRLNVILGSMTEEEFNEREQKRFYSVRAEGYKQIEIVSRKDWLPSDEVLKKMLSDAKDYFYSYPNHSWITFNIDEGIVKSAEFKRSYFFGQLRKIKSTDLQSA